MAKRVVTDEEKAIGKRLKAARLRKGLTQLALAYEANVSPSSVQRWEAGQLPPIPELRRYATLLNETLGELTEPEERAGDVAAIAAALDRLTNEVVQLRVEQGERLTRLEKRLAPPARRRAAAASA